MGAMKGQLCLFIVPDPPNDRECRDCGLDTVEDGEFYMVQDTVWPLEPNEVWPWEPQNSILCIGCLEHRLGRRLTSDDFTDGLLNRRGGHSQRLESRMSNMR